MYWGFENSINNLSFLISCWFTTFRLKFWTAFRYGFPLLNHINTEASLINKIEAGKSGSAQAYKNTIFSALTETVNAIVNNDVLKIIILVATTLSVVAILVKYGVVIFKTYFLNVDDQTAAPTMDFFKRVMYVLIMCLLAPTIMINGLFFSTYMGAAAGESILTNVKGGAEVSRAYFDLISTYGRKKVGNTYQRAGSFGLSAATYCATPHAEADSGEGYKNRIEKSTDCGFALTEGKCTAYYLNPNTGNYDSVDAYQLFCYGKVDGKNLYTQGEKQPSFYSGTYDGQKKSGYIRVGQFLQDSGAGDLYPMSLGSSSGILKLLSTLINLFFGIAIVYITAMRIVDLLSAMLMMFYYAQAYVSEVQSSAIGQFIKKISSIWLTQFFVVTMYAVYMAHSSTAEANMANLCLNIALFSVTMKAPNTIQDIMSSTGGANVLGGLASKARRAL